MNRTAVALGLAAFALAAPPLRAGDSPQYNRDVRPILMENCFLCHGPDSAARKADLRLDQRDKAVEVGAIVPGKPDESELIARIFATRPTKRMPPAKTHKSLTAAQKETLKRWIAAGAEYQPFWSFIPPVRPALPPVKDIGWVRTPVDRFILADLEKHGLKPAPEADKYTLARRLSLDLIGLPPTPEEVAAFVNDKSPEAYEKYVDRLLASPHWGEHRGRYWLDAARYADTHGIHMDNYREIWSYRDWVIRAFNKNMPFDEFTIEQLAGDLLPNATLDQRIASGFNRCNITTSEGGAINEEYLVLYARDRTETTSAVWMGLTANCAVCHDHKFDPITQRDFYSMSAFFNNTTQPAMDGNIKDTPPVIVVPRTADRLRWAALAKEIAAVHQQSEQRKKTARGDFDKWLAALKPGELAKQVPTAGLVLLAPLDEGHGKKLHLTVAGKPRELALKKAGWEKGPLGGKAYRRLSGATPELSDVGDFEAKQGFSYGAWVKLPKSNLTGPLMARMDEGNNYRGWDMWIQGGRIGAHIIHKWQEDAAKVVAQPTLKANEWHHVFVTYDGSGKAAGIKIYIDGVAQPTTTEADGLKGTIRNKVPFRIGQRSGSQAVVDFGVRDLRIYGRTLSAAEVARVAKGGQVAALAAKKKRITAETDEIYAWWLTALDTTSHELVERQAKLQAESATIKARGTVAYVMHEKSGPPMAYILNRGQYDQRRQKVTPDTFKSLPPFPPEFPRNRLGLSKWLLRPEHPLTARVTVNRFWQELFGTGIVRTTGDFGVTGEPPSNQELLDWLAVRFRESGWDVKRFFKMLVMSSAYRQSALATPEKLEKDPQNRLISRGPRFRMDAEMVRDYALAASGLLSPRLGGPSVKPYQPEGVWEAVAMIGSNTRDYKRDKGSALYRRSLYTFWKRAAPPASMEIFNAPTREVCTVRRERTDTPLQALVTLNDPQFVEAARALAQRALTEGGAKDVSRLDFLARWVLCRPLRPEELPVLQASLADLRAFYQSHPADAKKLIMVGESKPNAALKIGELAAWTMLANELLNLDEVLNK